MCRTATCPKCHKPTWKGCGLHVEQVLRDVPKADRCACRTNGPAAPAAPGTATTRGSWLSRLRPARH